VKTAFVLLAFVALVAAGPAPAADRVVERGIVQSIDPSAVVLRALDGTNVTVPLKPLTRYRLNGRDATLADIRPGFVAEVVGGGGGRAVVVRAFGRVERQVDRGVLARVVARAIVVRRGPGDTVRLPVTARTAVWRNGARVPVRVLRPGMRVEVTTAPNGSARVIVIVRAAR
jgi:hypothetical protein